jgi:hypothetical protein
MKKLTFIPYILLLFVTTYTTSCKKLLGLKKQTDYDYEHRTADAHIYKTARQFLNDRANGSPENVNDTVFRWMKMGLDYAGIDLAEYEKPGRTFIFLHNDAIKVWNATTKKVTGGFFFTFPIVDKDANGNPIVDPVTSAIKTHPAEKWSDYSKETVKNYFLYLIGEGEFNFEQLNNLNQTVQSLMPAGMVATNESILGYLTLSDGSKGLDIEGKFNLKILNGSDQAPIVFNDKTNDRSAGYIADNGIVHVFGATVVPFRANQ